jgi:tRNA threonylcarbamoyladenosine biosynthesis protein TsaE
MTSRFLADESATLDFGSALAQHLTPGLVIYLCGELGAAKTTLARGVLRGLGYAGRVKSPTFTLVEAYKLSKLYLYHFDFYRFDRPTEFGASGFAEYFGPDTVCLVEWPEKAVGLPGADLRIALAVSGTGRRVEIDADTEAGKRCLEELN